MDKSKLTEEEVVEETSTENKEAQSPAAKNNLASRARNRTVMLSPEMTGQVRAMLYKGDEKQSSSSDWSKLEAGKPVVSSPASAPSRNIQNAVESEGVKKDNFSDRRTTKIGQEFINQVLNNPAMVMRKEPEVAAVAPTYSTPVQGNKVAQSKPVLREVTPTSKLIGFFISFDNDQFGEIYEIRVGRWIVTSKPTDQGEFIQINDNTISPMHAVLRVTKEGKVQILDQLSEFGTGITRVNADTENDVSGTMETVDHGDIVRFGSRYFVVCLVPEFKKPA